MDREEFGKQIGELRKNIAEARGFYTVWLAIWPTEEAVDTLNRWIGFFGPIIKALNGMTMLQCTKMFDRDRRTVSFPNLLREAKKGPGSLVPHLSENGLDRLED